VIGGDIRLVDAQFYASGGRVALVSTASAGELRFDASDAAAAIDTSAFVQLGNIELLDHAFMYLSGERGGRFTADAENVSAETSFIFADNYGAADGLGIEINARDSITLANLTIISAFVFGSGNGGNINLNARSIVLNGYTDQGGNSVNIFTETGGDGKGGDVVIRADSFEMNGGNAIGVSASGPGDGGSIQITASSVRLNGQAFGAELAAFTAGGRSGGITITSDSLEIQSGAQIRTDTLAGSFDGGPIQITTSLLRLDGTGQGLLPTTIASTTSQDSVAAGGDITIRPNAGSKLTMEVWNGASVNTSSSTSGDGGNIHVEAADVRLQNGVSIQSSASGSGDAGNVAIGATGSVSLQQNSSLSVSSLQSDGGSITVTAGNEIRVKDSSVTAQAAVNGGDITLKADKLVYFLNSTLTAEAISGNGGNINIDPPLVVFNNSSINASSADAAGGNISIIASGFLASGTPITASGAQAGTISIQTPDQDITDELASLEEEPIDAETLLQPHCGVRLKNISTFSVLSRGAPIAPNQLLPSINVE
jgi:large exoprotein involved in heme utilization and adhesion